MQETQLGVSAVARHFNVDRGTLAKRLKEHYDNVISRPDGKLPINSNYFETIDTEHKAYWLGFIYADGYLSISGKTKRMGVSLCLKDKVHLQNFSKCIESNYPIHEYEVSNGYKIGWCECFRCRWICSDCSKRKCIF